LIQVVVTKLAPDRHARVADLTTLEWARLCRVEAVRTTHVTTKAFLVELAGEFEALAGKAVDLDPDDLELQDAVADRLFSLALKRSAWGCR
jgi:hypothetical protein